MDASLRGALAARGVEGGRSRASIFGARRGDDGQRQTGETGSQHRAFPTLFPSFSAARPHAAARSRPRGGTRRILRAARRNIICGHFPVIRRSGAIKLGFHSNSDDICVSLRLNGRGLDRDFSGGGETAPS
ncbi:hypothetical protein MPC4_230020 [Methylocella tundrae]|uniref:Uncharacterized protein n=1 Tax=Methylocella tundrae TaxID=227605 RepID=A0A8B6M6E8_METTU|nr:hypothetical protein MPC1_2120002 [Methylocella tundrae]VTZ50365.1 hypothetical protein MPC4_230020 [Methylocella tundrae]